MESQSMRKRQTVFGDQVLNPGLQPPKAHVGKHIRNFSRMTSKPEHSTSDARPPPQSSTNGSLAAQLSSPDFDASAFIAANLGSSSLDELAAFSDKLKATAQKYSDSEFNSGERTNTALNSLASNIAQVAPLVAELHKEINELSLVTSAMRQDAYAKRNADVRRISSSSQDSEQQDLEDRNAANVGKRQSVLALNALWAADLNEFYLKIENSQKYIPRTEGRHIVLESEGWLELNLVNQQPVKAILLVLLNDYLVLARNTNGRYHLDHFYNLKDSLDIKITQDKTLIVGQNADARGLLAPSRGKLRQLHSELVKLCALQQQPQQNQQSGSGKNSSSRPQSQQSFHHQNSMNKRTSIHQPLRPSTEDSREASQILADLDMEIAHREWGAAVAILNDHASSSLLAECLPQRRTKLFNMLKSELEQPQPKNRTQIVDVLRLFKELGFREESKHLFFDATAKDIELQARQVQFRGDVVNYISQLAAIYFQTVIYAVKVYRETFNKRGDSSAIVYWAKSQIDLYAEAFNRQLYKISPELRGYQKCREVSRLESQQLRGLKMEMEFMLRYVWEA